MKITDKHNKTHHLNPTKEDWNYGKYTTTKITSEKKKYYDVVASPKMDLYINSILMYIIPNGYKTLYIKLIFELIVFLFGVVMIISRYYHPSSLSDIATTYRNIELVIKLIIFPCLTILILLYLLHSLYKCRKYQKLAWMNPEITHYNRLPMHTMILQIHTNEEDARNAAVDPSPLQKNNTKNVWCLDDVSSWEFQLCNTVEEGLDVVLNYNNMNKKWRDICIPSNWMLIDGIDDIPVYTNIKYPFKCNPPIIPYPNNPTGVYRLEIDTNMFPNDWVIDSTTASRYSIVFHGIESSFFLFWNSHFIGFSKDSRLPAEFDISPYLDLSSSSDEKNKLEVVVCRWNDGSYLEDQDHWWLGGIFRSVYLVRYTPNADIWDYRILECDAVTGQLSVEVSLHNNNDISDHMNHRMIVAKLYTDEQNSPTGGLTKGELVWKQQKQEVTQQSSNDNNNNNNSNTTVLLSGVVQHGKPLQWNAEQPNLYTLTLSLLHNDDTIIKQVESCRIGFRTIQIINKEHPKQHSILTINEKAITISGINRHEHHPLKGKVQTIQDIIQDLTLLKQYNFNSIRTSHYPNTIEFYHLASYFGFYIIDEANIETHGIQPFGRLNIDYQWEEAYTSRIVRMVQRDFNYTCIIGWSLGNENGRGWNMNIGRDMVNAMDSSRFIMYEGAGSWGYDQLGGRTELTDVICPMYPSIDKLKSYNTKKEYCNDHRPIILCEYSHSMGNSNGNLHYYWNNIFWDNQTYPQYQGGFVWDMIDQGIRIPLSQQLSTTTNDTNTQLPSSLYYYGYGGDFNDKIHDANFCINGLFSPDRIPHPAIHEFKRLQQPVHFFVQDSISLPTIIISSPTTTTGDDDVEDEVAVTIIPEITLGVMNRYSFQNLSHLNWTWEITTDISHQPISSGTFFITDDDLSNSSITIPLYDMDSTTLWNKFSVLQNSTVLPNKCWFNIKGCLNHDTIWACKGYNIVQYQCILPFKTTATSCCNRIKKRDISTTSNTNNNETNSTTTIRKMHIHNDSSKIIISSIIHDESTTTTATKNGNKQPMVQIDRTTGFLTHYYIPQQQQQPNDNNTTTTTDNSSINILSKPLKPNFTRASTDNDRGGIELLLAQNVPDSFLSKLSLKFMNTNLFSHEYHWKRIGLVPHGDNNDDDNILIFRCDDVSIHHPTSNIDDYEDSDIVTNSVLDYVLITTKTTVISHSNNSNTTTKELFELETSYRIFNNISSTRSTTTNHQTAATILVKCKVSPIHPILQSIPSLPRIGMTMALPYNSSMSKVKYVGRGPYENYPDRKYAADFGYHVTTPDSMHEDTYIVPTENGNRCDCFWISFTTTNDATTTNDEKSNSTTNDNPYNDSEETTNYKAEGGVESGICIIPCNYDNNTADTNAAATLNFSTSLYSQKQLHEAKHTCDLQQQQNDANDNDNESSRAFHVNLDHALMGLGGDVSWQPCVYEEFLVKPKEYKYSFWMIPLLQDQDPIMEIQKFQINATS